MKGMDWLRIGSKSVTALSGARRQCLTPVPMLILIFLVVIICSSAGLAAMINLPQTQYDSSHEGDDGDIMAGVRWDALTRFTDNHDGTVTDKLTTLMWLKDSNCAWTINYNPDGLNWSIDPHHDLSMNPKNYTYFWGSMSWKNAMDYVEGINLNNIDISACGAYNAGYTDWRMPNINELVSLLYAYPSSVTGLYSAGSLFFDHSDHRTTYWSSTSVKSGNPDIHKWVAERETMIVSSNPAYPDYYAVWPVRSGISSSTDPNKALVPQTGQFRSYYTSDDGSLKKGVDISSRSFIDHGDGTVTDTLTGLMWQKDANCLGNELGWRGTGDCVDVYGNAGALEYALNCISKINAGLFWECSYGYMDWRLPNIVELRSLLNYGFSNPALPPMHPFIMPKEDKFPKLEYWSSTGDYMVDFQYGTTKRGQTAYVWPVRGGQYGIPLPEGQKNYSYPAVPYRVWSEDPGQARPISLGTVALTPNGPYLQLSVGLSRFNGPVDLYLAIAYLGMFPQLNSPLYIIVLPDNTLQTFSGNLVPWKSRVFKHVDEQLFGFIPADNLPRGYYIFYLAAAPAGSLNSFYCWQTDLFLPIYIP